MTIANVPTNQKRRNCIWVLPLSGCECELSTTTKWIAACSDQSECECLIRWEIHSDTDLPQSSACHPEEKLHWSPNRIRHEIWTWPIAITNYLDLFSDHHSCVCWAMITTSPVSHRCQYASIIILHWCFVVYRLSCSMCALSCLPYTFDINFNGF